MRHIVSSRDTLALVGSLVSLIIMVTAVLLLSFFWQPEGTGRTASSPVGGEPTGPTPTPGRAPATEDPPLPGGSPGVQVQVAALPTSTVKPWIEGVPTPAPFPFPQSEGVPTTAPFPFRWPEGMPTPASFPFPLPAGMPTPGGYVEPTSTPTPTPSPTPTPPPTATREPTYTPMPTYTPFPTPTETLTPEPTTTAEAGTPGTETATPNSSPTPVLTALPVETISGTIQWHREMSPVVVDRTVQLLPDSVLIIGAGTEVRLDEGASLNVDSRAQLYISGTPDQPVRLVGHRPGHWQGIFGRPGSLIILEHAEIRDGGSTGTVLLSEQGELIIRESKFLENHGTILVSNSKAEIRGCEMWGNDYAYGGAVMATYTEGNFLTLTGNRIGRNRMSDGASSVEIALQNAQAALILDIQGNLVQSEAYEHANLLLSSTGLLEGTVSCNSFIGGQTGLHLRTETPQIPNFKLSIFHNLADDHVPPVVPDYLNHGIGRGAISEIPLDMRQNWWGEPSGPYHPEENPEGRGDAVGSNILYRPWLDAPPPCVPWP
ncbi:MAG: hypothetical protein HC884_06145 [Chloroflexaceae bacterium]|nr:hypothetical protein [Chloroflexaceae bacterium]